MSLFSTRSGFDFTEGLPSGRNFGLRGLFLTSKLGTLAHKQKELLNTCYRDDLLSALLQGLVSPYKALTNTCQIVLASNENFLCLLTALAKASPNK
jgi:hypothetical protein